MSEVAAREVTFVRTGSKLESRFFTNTILGDVASRRIRVVGRDDGSAFVYPVVFGPNGAGGRDDRSFAYLADLPADILGAIRGGRGMLAIDHSNEGTEPKPLVLRAMHERFADLGIDPARVMMLTQNILFEKGYAAWLQAQGEGAPPPFHVGLYHCFLRQMATYVTREMIPSGEFARRRAAHIAAVEQGATRPKHYLTLNFTPRGHRLATMLHIMQHGLEEKGHISFPGLANRKLNIAGRTEDLLDRTPFPDLDALRTLLPILEAQPPRLLDTDPFVRISPVINVGEWWYYFESWFSLVTESGIHAREQERFTEKPFKAILGLHPFLILGLPRTLHLLREHGFRSFSPLIDETYDTLDDDAARMVAVLGEFRRLCDLPSSAWPELGRQLLDTVLHNYDQFDGPLQRHFTEREENPLLDRMAALAAPSNPAPFTPSERSLTDFSSAVKAAPMPKPAKDSEEARKAQAEKEAMIAAKELARQKINKVIIDDREIEFRGQHQQDQFVYDLFFKGKTGGTFFECGALDGIYLSNTYAFEKFFGWRGVMVEPLTHQYAALTVNRPNSVCYNACVGPNETTVLFFNHKGGGLSGIVKEVGRAHIERLEYSYSVNPKSYHREEPLLKLEWKPVMRTTRAIKEAGISHIDFFSLDVEGGEPSVLAGLDMSELTIDVFCVEVNQQSIAGVMAWMDAGGFKPVASVGQDLILAHSSFLEKLAKDGVDLDQRMAATTVRHKLPRLPP